MSVCVAQVLGNALYLVRIPTMSLEEFANGAAQLGILTQQETIDLFLHFTAHIKPHLNYPTKARTGLKPQVTPAVTLIIWSVCFIIIRDWLTHQYNNYSFPISDFIKYWFILQCVSKFSKLIHF